MDQPEYAALVAAAGAARERAYAPYSHFAVGAAALSGSGQMYLGANIENAAYPLTMCAERVALGAAYAAGERQIVALAVVTPTEGVASPCGACRQVIAELMPEGVVLLSNLAGAVRQTTPAELLPYGFGAPQLAESQRSDAV